MMKKKIRVSKEPSSSSSYFPAGEEARARFKYHCLFQDYHVLLKETEEKRERLEKTLQKKLQLLAEVKFLGRKCQQFSTTPPTVPFKLKQQQQQQFNKSPSSSVCLTQSKDPVFQNELLLKRRSHKPRLIPAPASTPLFDLNQVFLPAGEEMEWQNGGVNGFSREGEDALANDAMLSICRGSGIAAKGTNKRKVSWLDQLALRV